MTNVAILVPGIMGSELRLKEEVIWPGSLWELKLPYKKMEKLKDPNLVATDVIRSFSVSEQYQGLINDLAKCDFREDGDPPTLFICPYDWRKDNSLSAKVLADLIDKAFAKHGDGIQISIIGHSMGGLISRYYLESGEFTSRPGFSHVKRLLTLGTPHRGAPLALGAALGLEKRLFLNAEQVKELVSDTRYPALYQLLPPPGEPFVWDEHKSAEYGQIDVYDNKVAQVLGLVPENLEAARAFHSKLDINKRPQYEGKPIRYFFFVGTRQKTVSAITLLKIDEKQYRVRRSELEDAGDGTVPAWSGSVTGTQGQPVGGEHSTIYRNDLLLRTMAILLGKAGVLAADPERVEVALRERVVNPGDLVHVALTFASGVDKLDGKLSVQRVLFGDDEKLQGFASPVSLHPISYAGLNAEKLSVIFTAPTVPALYRVAYYPSGYNEPAGKDELFVQET
ncbi:MAG: hypothetical protein AABM67_01975 [Acidobacteriota bacterium]